MNFILSRISTIKTTYAYVDFYQKQHGKTPHNSKQQDGKNLIALKGYCYTIGV
jgi:hypothetical protein